MLSWNEKVKAVRDAAKLGAEYRKQLVIEGADARDALDAMNNFVSMYLSSMGVLTFDPKDDSEKWKGGGEDKD